MTLKNRANLPIEDPDYEGNGQGVIVVTLLAALSSMIAILYALIQKP